MADGRIYRGFFLRKARRTTSSLLEVVATLTTLRDREVRRAVGEALVVNILPPGDACAVMRWLKLTAAEVNRLPETALAAIRECLANTLVSWGIAELVTGRIEDDEMQPLLLKMKVSVDVIYRKLQGQPASALLSAACYYLIKAQSIIATTLKVDEAVRPRIMKFMRHLSILAPTVLPGAAVSTVSVESAETAETAHMMAVRAEDDGFSHAMTSVGQVGYRDTVGQIMFHVLAGTAIAAVALFKLQLNQGKIESLLSLSADPEDSDDSETPTSF
jgi:hypothetical protein